MKLIGCHIENFGKISDETILFHEGCNVFCRQNGWGKSTLAAFLKVMLYGFLGNGKKDEIKNERKRYQPWQGGVFGGTLTFEAAGKQYILERTFGSKEAEDTFVVRDAVTNLECDDFSEEIGKELFQIDAESFNRTVFIAQNGCQTAATDDIHAKLGNLTDNTDDINNYEAADKTLSNLLNRLSPKRKTGSLAQMKQTIGAMKEAVRAGEEIDLALQQVKENKNRQYVRYEELAKTRKALQEKQKSISAYKDVAVLQQKYKGLCETLAAREEKAEQCRQYFPGAMPEPKDLEACIRDVQELSGKREKMERYALTEDEQERKEEEERMFVKGVPEETQMFKLEEKAKQIREIHERIKAGGLSREEERAMQQYERRFADGVPKSSAIDEQIANWERRMETKNAVNTNEAALHARQEVSRQMLERAQKMQKERSGGISVLALVGVLIAAAGVCVAVALKLLVFGIILMIVGIGTLLYGFMNFKPQSSELAREHYYEDPEILELQRKIEEDKRLIVEIEMQARDFFVKYNLEFFKEQLISHLYEFKKDLEEYQKLKDKVANFEAADLQERCRQYEEELKEELAPYYVLEEIAYSTQFSEQIQMIRELARDYRELLKKEESLDAARQEFKRANGSVEAYIAGLSFEVEENVHRQLFEIQKHLQQYQVAMQEVEEAQAARDAFEDKVDMDKLAHLTDENAGLSVEAITDQLREVIDEMDGANTAMMEYDKQMENLQEERDSISEQEERLDLLQEEYAQAKQQYRLLEQTKYLLEYAKDSFTSKYQEPVFEGFNKYYRLFAGEEALQYHLDAKMQLTVEELGMQRKVASLSVGYRDFLGICMRMALIEAMYPQEKPFIIFDDPFANLDEEKTSGAMQFLDEIASEYQVIYFTCNKNRQGIS